MICCASWSVSIPAQTSLWSSFSTASLPWPRRGAVGTGRVTSAACRACPTSPATGSSDRGDCAQLKRDEVVLLVMRWRLVAGGSILVSVNGEGDSAVLRVQDGRRTWKGEHV